jgi:4-hydroxybenzoate polyprenyltransferase
VLNDVFDRHIDAARGPSGPCRSGRASVASAAWLGGPAPRRRIEPASRVTDTAAAVAALDRAAVLCYDAWGKRQMFIGPVNMGLCRGLNLVLGMASAPEPSSVMVVG